MEGRKAIKGFKQSGLVWGFQIHREHPFGKGHRKGEGFAAHIPTVLLPGVRTGDNRSIYPYYVPFP
jgi:hypothetical protein